MKSGEGELWHLVASRFPVTNRLGVCRRCSAWAILGLEVFPTQGLPSATLLPTNHIVDHDPALVSSSAGSPKSCPRFQGLSRRPRSLAVVPYCNQIPPASPSDWLAWRPDPS